MSEKLTFEQTLRNVERIRIILDRSAVNIKDLKDGQMTFDGFRIGLIDAIHLFERIDAIEQYLRRK